MSLADLRPEPPAWAIQAGLPSPMKEESFADYASRVGLDSEELLDELTDSTAMLANYRLESVLARHLPEQWRRYLRDRCHGTEPTPPLAETLMRSVRSHSIRPPTV